MGRKKLKISDKAWEDLQKIQELYKQENMKIDLSEILNTAIDTYLKSEFTHATSSASTNSTNSAKSTDGNPIKPPTTKINAPKVPSKISPPALNPSALHIPPAPKKKPVKLEIDKDDLERLSKRETAETKYILIECQFCGSKPIMMPVPKRTVLESQDPVVDISYVHGEPEHVIVAQLDHDFQVRRRRASWVVFEKDYQPRKDF